MEKTLSDDGSRLKPISTAAMSDSDFRRLGEFIHGSYGIRITPAKKVMLESRLSKRLKALNMKSYRDYCEYLFSSKGMNEELVHMIDMVTTNKTDFFREPAHFEFLANKAVPELLGGHRAPARKKLAVWSAGCSTGEEPYTLAMVLDACAEKYSGLQYSIDATDISTRVLQTARTAIYDEEKIATVPAAMQKKYLLRGKGGRKGMVRIVPELRGRISFSRLNFMDEDACIEGPLDIIFCRNVIIYFDRPTQERLLRRFCNCLVPGGYIFMGHSETLNGMELPLTSVAPTVYRKNL